MSRPVLRLAAVLLLAGAPVGCAARAPHPAAATGCEASSGQPGRSIAVRTVDRLRAALADARPGDRISLAPGRYDAPLAIRRAGTPARPIELCGPASAVVDPGDTTWGYGLRLDGAAWWTVRGLTVTGAQKGIVLDHSPHVVLAGIRVHDVGYEAVHLRSGSSDVVLDRLAIWRTGRQDPRYGEGVYVGSAERHWCEFSGCKPDRVDRVRISGCRFGPLVTAENIDVKEGTSDGVIDHNVFDGTGTTAAESWVNVKGNRWRLVDNTGTHAPRDGVQVHVVVAGWGRDAFLMGNDFAVNAAGYGVRVDRRNQGAVVACDNVVTGASAGLSNVACSTVR